MSPTVPQLKRYRPPYPHEIQLRPAGLNEPLKRPPRPNAHMRRVGLVQAETAPAMVENYGDLVMPPNNGIAGTKVTNHGGGVASGIRVQLVFWGSSWNLDPANHLARKFVRTVALLLAGPYYSGLKQYGISIPPVLCNPALVVTPDPGLTFDDDSIGDLVWNLIDQNVFPEPGKSTEPIAYVIMPHAESSYGSGALAGAHSHPADYDFSPDIGVVGTAWIGFSDIDRMTRTFAKEIAGLCTNPSGEAWHTDGSGAEIGDICSTRRGFLNGIPLESYWSKGANACVLRRNWGFEVSAVSRNPNNLDLFVTGTDGVVYTSWWSVREDWSGIGNHWRAIGGAFPVGAPVSAVVANPNEIDLFVVGNDGPVYTSWWSVGEDWSGVGNRWRPIGGTFPIGSRVTAIARRPDNLDLFIVGNDGVVYNSWKIPGEDWSGMRRWRAIGGVFPSGAEIAAVARVRGQLDLFVTGSDGHVHTSGYTAGSDWSGIGNHWRDIGGSFPPGAPITAVTANPDRLDLFIVGLDGAVYTSWWTPHQDWLGLANRWRPIGAGFPINARVTAVARTPRQLDLFIVGYDGLVYTSSWTADQDWSGLRGWRLIGGVFPIGAQVSAVARSASQLDLFVLGSDGVVYTACWSAREGWSGIGNQWRPIGGIFPAGV